MGTVAGNAEVTMAPRAMNRHGSRTVMSEMSTSRHITWLLVGTHALVAVSWAAADRLPMWSIIRVKNAKRTLAQSMNEWEARKTKRRRGEEDEARKTG